MNKHGSRATWGTLAGRSIQRRKESTSVITNVHAIAMIAVQLDRPGSAHCRTCYYPLHITPKSTELLLADIS